MTRRNLSRTETRSKPIEAQTIIHSSHKFLLSRLIVWDFFQALPDLEKQRERKRREASRGMDFPFWLCHFLSAFHSWVRTASFGLTGSVNSNSKKMSVVRLVFDVGDSTAMLDSSRGGQSTSLDGETFSCHFWGGQA
eukprot:6492727-Amphidinium_carterae.2